VGKKGWIAIAIGAGCAVLLAIGLGALGVGLIATNLPEVAGPPAAEEYVVPDAAQVEVFGRELEAAIHVQGRQGVVSYFDVRAMALSALPDAVPAGQREEAVAGFEQGFTGEGLLPGLESELASGGRYEYRGVVERDGRPVARFRLLPSLGGISFHDYVVGRSSTGELRAIDLHSMNTGEYLSETIGGLFATMFSGNPDLIGRLRGDENPFIEDAEKLQRMKDLTLAGDGEGALAVYDTMSEEARADRTFFLMRVQAAALIEDDERYLEILDELGERFPDDPAANANLLDAYFLREKWTECERALEVLATEYPDPYWDTLRARVYLGSGRVAEARAAAERAVATEPTLIDTHDALLFVSLGTADDDRADEALVTLMDQFAVDPALLMGQPGYERVSELPSYRARVGLP
jgi:hypothetical protein